MDLSAHPDDEDGATLAYYRMKLGVRTYSVLFTRGEGGQNEKGPELYEELGVLRSEETREAGRVLGAEVHFLNFLDFGFSKTATETFRNGEESGKPCAGSYTLSGNTNRTSCSRTTIRSTATAITRPSLLPRSRRSMPPPTRRSSRSSSARRESRSGSRGSSSSGRSDGLKGPRTSRTTSTPRIPRGGRRISISPLRRSASTGRRGWSGQISAHSRGGKVCTGLSGPTASTSRTARPSFPGLTTSGTHPLRCSSRSAGRSTCSTTGSPGTRC